jgi:NAD(P)-dependent dehydrogenase (short-subunit alcohol dehydrogenase family)
MAFPHEEAVMTTERLNTALIVGAGAGLSAALARALAHDGVKLALAARSTSDLADLANETGAALFACDASRRGDVDKLFADLDAGFGAPEIVAYNPSYRVRGPLLELDPVEVEKTLIVTAYGGFLVGQHAARRMVPKRRGVILFTGASASVKGYAQSMSRELHPLGIHVAHVVIDGGIKSARRAESADNPASLLDPDAIAASYLHLIRQPRSAWSAELELRPWVEKF